MKKTIFYVLGAIAVIAAGLAFYYLKSPAERDLRVDFSIADHLGGDYAVGSITTFVKNPEAKFDPWGARYGGEAYQQLLTEIDASGEPRTIVTEIWYPASTTDGYPQANFGDYFGHDEQMLASIVGFAGEGMSDAEAEEFTAGLATLPRNSYIGAPVAEGKFPVIVFVHGLGGKRVLWNNTAEQLASDGYVVVAMTMPSDGTLPPVFNDPNSRFVAANGRDAVKNAYEIMGEDIKVFPRFLEFLYGLDVSDLSPETFPDLGSATAPAGGADKMTGMMARLFQQRVNDVATIIEELRVLADDPLACEEHFAAQGLVGKQCGLLHDRLDFDNIGMSGHSLGSISTQVALRQLPDIKAGLGFNNGIPKRWEPLSHGVAPDGTREVIDKPFAQVHGTEDAFVYFVFQLLFGDWYENSGGDREEIFLLDDELAPRTADHSQPVVFAAYNRAVGPKLVASIIDANHDGIDSAALSQFMRDQGVEQPLVARRLPDHDGVLGQFPGPNFNLLELATDQDGQLFRLPTFIADYYLSAWFDLQLKGDRSALERIENTPFAEHVKVRSDGL